MKLTFKETERSGKETIKATRLTKSFEDKVIFHKADLLIHYGERTALIGANGSGKTTFLKMLLGEVQPDSGVVELGANVRPAYLPQTLFFPNEDLTVLECFREDFSIMEGKAREYLSKFMFYGSSVFKKVNHLSGGERIRLKLSQLLYEDVNLLILDEPTNHLDIHSIETFEEALEEFKGTIFFISHDRYFINKMSKRIIALQDQTFKTYPGNYDDYKDAQAAKSVEIPAKKIIQPKNGDTMKKKAEATNVEMKIITLENEIKELDLAMTVPRLDYEVLHELYGKKEELSSELDIAMDLWLELTN
ncbi:ABC-F family ATP-binding cassette domain-containing protein [Anaerobacillus sp. CMMVII]|uniref:ATP-binding cassette domain-containing protein n=1 Tax=Anaerobacillus sp. CMMVII TaxID=2755588 RepID=UPI0021B766A9|nr:ATP-binding cassette domain-containing protein [Anaerobacillus sp. CMMVII]MCT8137819.1 ABC-F family ATP-binding cassette domain-containing protein [Anaerobacillus sp. CMMVII]